MKVYGWLDTSELISDEVSGTGWNRLLCQLLDEIDQLVADTPTKLRLFQVKEKFGVLRFYRRVEGATDATVEQIKDAVREAEIVSQRTCFTCGKPAETRRVGEWIIPLCEDHSPVGHIA